MEVSRRSFLSGAAVGAAGLGLASLVGCAPKSESSDGSASNGGSGDTAYSFEVAPDAISENDITETIEADVVVVGGGTSGLCAATTAMQGGCDVVVISASKAPVSRGGSNHAVYSKTMEAAGIERYDADKFFRKEFLVGGNANDHRKWYKFLHNSEEAMNWAIDLVAPYDISVGLETTTHIAKDDPFYTPLASHSFINADNPIAGLGQSLFVNTMATEIEKGGSQIFWSTIARQLVRGGNPNGTDGRVDAVIAEREDGTFAKYVGKKAVVLATGDFSKNEEMMQKYCPWAAPLLSNVDKVDYDAGMVTGSLMPGDGQKMGLWIGAAWQRNQPNPAMISGNGATNFCNQPLMGHTGLMVNIQGERYSNEYSIGSMSNRNALTQTDGRAFMIWGQNYLEGNAPWGRYPANYGAEPLTNEEEQERWDNFVDKGSWFKADTLEEVIDKLGLPSNTMDTIERYNELCEKGVDEDFNKPAQFMVPIKDGPFYGFENTIRFLTVLGGLRTNANMQVCDESDTPIDGLYNVGTMVGDFFANLYTFMLEGGNYGACCLTFGYLAGKYIAENE